jgi:hypothetical protein
MDGYGLARNLFTEAFSQSRNSEANEEVAQ